MKYWYCTVNVVTYRLKYVFSQLEFEKFSIWMPVYSSRLAQNMKLKIAYIMLFGP